MVAFWHNLQSRYYYSKPTHTQRDFKSDFWFKSCRTPDRNCCLKYGNVTTFALKPLPKYTLLNIIFIKYLIIIILVFLFNVSVQTLVPCVTVDA